MSSVENGLPLNNISTLHISVEMMFLGIEGWNWENRYFEQYFLECSDVLQCDNNKNANLVYTKY